jgi:hypothetical protein
MTYTLEITEADGSTRREHLQIDASESEAPSPEVVAELARLTRTPLPPQLEGPTQ